MSDSLPFRLVFYHSRVFWVFVLGVLIGLLTGCASWRTSDKVLGLTATAAIGADCGTTIHALKSPVWIEHNPILGERPSPGEVILFCSLATVATIVVADMLPRNGWRTGWLAGITTLEALFTLHNVDVITFNPWELLR